MPRGGEAVPGEGGGLLPLLLCIRRTGEERAAGNAQVAPPRRVHASRSQSRRDLAAISPRSRRNRCRSTTSSRASASPRSRCAAPPFTTPPPAAPPPSAPSSAPTPPRPSAAAAPATRAAAKGAAVEAAAAGPVWSLRPAPPRLRAAAVAKVRCAASRGATWCDCVWAERHVHRGPRTFLKCRGRHKINQLLHRPPTRTLSRETRGLRRVRIRSQHTHLSSSFTSGARTLLPDPARSPLTAKKKCFFGKERHYYSPPPPPYPFGHPTLESHASVLGVLRQWKAGAWK